MKEQYQDGDINDFTAWEFDKNEAAQELKEIIEAAKDVGYQLENKE